MLCNVKGDEFFLINLLFKKKKMFDKRKKRKDDVGIHRLLGMFTSFEY